MTQIDPSPPRTGSALSEKAASKDIWDKISTLTTLISSVVIGAAGVAATYLYNNKELEVKHIERQQEEDRLERQADASVKVERTKRLEALYKFVSSEKPGERTFGYAMFSALGEESLAARLIAARQDSAGVDVTQSILRDELVRYKPYLENIGFVNLQSNVRLIAFSPRDLETTVPSEYRDTVSAAIKEGFVSFYYDGTMFIQNDWVDRPFIPLREYTHHALFQVLKKPAEQTAIESGLADYYPASYLNLVDTSVKGPAGFDLSFLQDPAPRPSDWDEAGPGAVIYRGRLWAASFWECRQKLSRPVVDEILLRAWVRSHTKGAEKDGEADRFRGALLSLATAPEASCFQAAFSRRGLLKS